MKYDSLKETPTKTITGGRHTGACFTYLWRGKQLTVVEGFPRCPECKRVLQPDWNKGSWHCPECGTAWITLELIQAIENEDALVTVSARNLED